MTLCQVKLSVGQRGDGRRVDAYLPARMGCFSRTQIQQLIAQGHVQVDGQSIKASHRLRVGMTIDLSYPPQTLKPLLPRDDVALEVVWEDASVLAVNKPAGMPSQPRHRFEGGTLVNAVLHYLDLSGQNGPGIMHRLDRNTSGVVLIGKTAQARAALGRQFEQHRVAKEYRALVRGVPSPGLIRLPIGPDPQRRERMVVGGPDAQPAQTRVEVLEVLAGGRYSLVACYPRTGRTHQIRVHLAGVGTPIVCDDFYGVAQAEPLPLARHALHALRIEVRHPVTEQPLTVEAPLPPDIQHVLQRLRRHEES